MKMAGSTFRLPLSRVLKDKLLKLTSDLLRRIQYFGPDRMNGFQFSKLLSSGLTLFAVQGCEVFVVSCGQIINCLNLP